MNNFNVTKYLDGLLYAKIYDRNFFDLAKTVDDIKELNVDLCETNTNPQNSLIGRFLEGYDVIDIINHIEEKTGTHYFLRNEQLEEEPLICAKANSISLKKIEPGFNTEEITKIVNDNENLKKFNKTISDINNLTIEQTVNRVVDNLLLKDDYSVTIQLSAASHFYPLCIKKKGNEIIFITSEDDRESDGNYSAWSDTLIESFKNRIAIAHLEHPEVYEEKNIYVCSVEPQNKTRTINGKNVSNICAIETVRKAYEIQQKPFEYYKSLVNQQSNNRDNMELNNNINKNNINNNINKINGNNKNIKNIDLLRRNGQRFSPQLFINNRNRTKNRTRNRTLNSDRDILLNNVFFEQLI